MVVKLGKNILLKQAVLRHGNYHFFNTKSAKKAKNMNFQVFFRYIRVIRVKDLSCLSVFICGSLKK